MTTSTLQLDRRHWKTAVAAGMASLLDSSIIVATGICLAIWADAFEFSSWTSGAVSAFLTFSIAVGALVGGRLSDLLGRTRVFNFDILVFALGVAIVALAQGETMILGGLILAGLAAGADLPTSIAVVSERSPAGAQGRLVGFSQVMWMLGIGVTTAMGFAFSTSGLVGARILFGWMTVVALVTWAFRVFNRDFRSLESQIRPTADETSALPMRDLLSSRPMMNALLLTGIYYVAWGLLANTFGQFQTYFLVTVSGATQSLATGIGNVTVAVGLIFSIVYVRMLDTRWRNPAFYVGATLQIVAMILIALSGGSALPLLLAGLTLYYVSNNFAGEATYKVWTQESFPVNARATAQGLSYGVGRTAFALFALVTPTILEFDPAVVLWLLVGLAVLTLLLGSAFIRYQNRQGTYVSQQPAPTSTP